MSAKKFAFAGIAYFVTTLIFATEWHLVLFNEIYRDFGLREQPIFQLGMLSILSLPRAWPEVHERFVDRS